MGIKGVSMTFTQEIEQHKQIMTEQKNKIKELEQEKCELLGIIQEKDKAIKKLIADMAGLEEENEQLRNNGFTVSAMTEQQLKVAIEKGEQLEKQLEVAKDLIHQFLIQNPISDWLPKKAENFLKETDNDRKAD